MDISYHRHVHKHYTKYFSIIRHGPTTRARTHRLNHRVLLFLCTSNLFRKNSMLLSCLDLLVLRNKGIRESTRDAHLEMGDGDACMLHSQEGKLIACMFPVNPSTMHATSKCTRPQALDFAPCFKISHARGVSRPVGASGVPRWARKIN